MVAAQTQGQARGRATAPGQQKKTTPAVADATPSPGAGPIVVFETVKGTFEMETYPNEAPKSVEHILTLVRRNFYNGLRVHRLVKGQLVQFGDPLSRDMSKRDRWGTGGSGKSIGVAEISPEAEAPGRLGGARASWRSAVRRQPVVRDADSAAEVRQGLCGHWPRDCRNGCRPEASGNRRHSSRDVREAKK